MKRRVQFPLFSVVVLIWFLSLPVWAESTVYQYQVKQTFDSVYKALHTNLEKNKFYVIFEAKISNNLRRFEKDWGKDYNVNKLETIRSLLVCNIKYTNRVANLDPTMLALCPLRIVLVEKKPNTRILFVKPSVIAAKSKALPVIKEIESKIIATIESTFKSKK